MQKQNAICKPRAQYAIAFLNYLKRIALQQLMLRTQVFTKNFLAQRTQLFKIKDRYSFVKVDAGKDKYGKTRKIFKKMTEKERIPKQLGDKVGNNC